MSDPISAIQVGKRYQHFKGGKYIVIAVATHSETGESLVIYASIESPDKIWARPLSLWYEPIRTKAGKKPRFVELP
jgi:hypothetical protein